ncbi:MAG: hypothetical protein ABIP90_12300, partial [Vicinamibacterales bacterium]
MGEHEIKYAMVVLMGSRAVVLLRRAQVLSCVTLLALVGSRGDVRAGGPAPQPDIRPIKGFERFQEWSRLVWEHVPGEFDPSARMVNSWPPADLFAVKADLWASVTLVNAGLGPGAVVQYTGFNELIRPTQMARPTSRPRSIRVEDVFDLLILTRDRATGRPDDAQIARFMKRAAMLHTDVAMLSPPGALPREPSAAERASTTRRVVDGQDIGWDARPIHWEIARAAIDGVRPAGGALGPVRLVAVWYR